LQPFGGDDIRGKLCHALALTVSGKKPQSSSETVPEAVKQKLQSPSPVRKPPPRGAAPKSPTVRDDPPPVVSRFEAKPSPRTQRPPPPPPIEVVPSDAVEFPSDRAQTRPPPQAAEIVELKARLNQLRQRWK
jgi:hypothetical protein